MSFIGTKFSYNNQSSEDFGVSLVRMDTGFLNRTMMQRTINREKLRYRDIPIYYNTEKQTYPLPITIAKIDPNDRVWTLEDRLRVNEWLMPDDDFHDFESEDYPDIVFPLQFTKIDFNDNYINEGYMNLDSEMESPTPYTRPSTLKYDLSDNTSTTILEIDNLSNAVEYYYPIFEFTVLGGTSLKIKNLTVGGEETIFNNNLITNEVLSVDNQNQRIISSTGNERITGFNFVFLRLIKGTNRLEITGQGLLDMKTCFPIMI